MKVWIQNGPNGVGLGSDYTKYVVDGSLSIEDSINVPTLITFQLSNTDQLFVVPRRSAYVTVVSEVYASGGGYGSGKILATGFITTEPERTFLGLKQGIKATNIPPNVAGAFQNQVYTYNINVSSDEWLLNANSVPYIPAFVNQTDSQILASIAEALYPGFFNTTAMASGNLVPYYQYNPSQSWSDIAKTFGDQWNYHYKAINRQIIYQPFGDDPLGIAYDDTVQTEKSIAPLEMTTGLVTVPPVNDCIVIGDIEPQTNWDNYFVGDGFSSNFQLRHIVWDGVSSQLLSDDWTESSFTTGTWTINDPLGCCVLVDTDGNAVGSLNVIQKGATGTYLPINSATYIQAQNGLELGGGINLQHGQIVFNDTAVGGGGIIGGIYGTALFTPGNCLAGFGITGQSAEGPFGVSGVEILNGNTPLVNIYVITQTPTLPLQSGNVLQCAFFQNAGFLNNTKQVVQSVTLLGYTSPEAAQRGTQSNAVFRKKFPVTILQELSGFVFEVVVQGTAIWANPYPFTIDAGTVTAVQNDVVVTASGAAGIVMQPILNGEYVGQPVISQINCQYVLQTWIGANTQTRYTRQYSNLTRSAFYGDQNLAASGAVTFVVTQVNLGNYVVEEQNPLFGLFPAAPPPLVTQYTATNVTLPPFAVYCLINGIDLNVSINYTVLSTPPQGYLTVQSLTGMSGGNLPWLPSQLSKPIVYQLGYGMINQTAQISQSGEAYALSFYTDDIPSVGARLRFMSWSSGQSIARVRDTAAVAAEAAISGDSGVRSAIMTNLSPLPRSSDECEAAAAAAILDREYPQFQGSYTVVTIPYKYESLFSPSMYDYPKTGEFFWVNSAVRGVSGQNFVVNTVNIQVVELRQEVLNISIDYGPDLYLEKLLPAFLESEQNLLVPQQTAAPPNYITLSEVLNAYLPTLDNAHIALDSTGTPLIVNSLTGNYVTIDLGAPPVTACEVRNVDSGWGASSYNFGGTQTVNAGGSKYVLGTPDTGLVGYFTSQVFTVPRTVRDQTWYLRTVNGSQYSRFSKAIRVVAPLIPSSPTLVSTNSTTAVFDYAGDVRDIYGLEVRCTPVSGILFYIGTPTLPDNIQQFSRAPVQVSPLTQNNVLAVYNPLTYTEPFPFNTQLNVGDIVYTSCGNDGSFTDIEIITSAATAVSPVSAVSASGITLATATAYFYPNYYVEQTGFVQSYPMGSTGEDAVQATVPGLGSLQFNSAQIGKGNDPNVAPMLNDIYDANGQYHNTQAVPPQLIRVFNGSVGFANYSMIVNGTFYVATPGNYNIYVTADDCIMWGISGAQYVSGPKYNPSPVGQTVTAMNGYPILGAWNDVGYHGNMQSVINFPAAGFYPFEFDYAQYLDGQTLVITYSPVTGQGAVPAPVPNSGYVIIPSPPNVGFPGVVGVPWEFGWFDYGNSAPDVQGQLSANTSIGTVQQIQTGNFSLVASGGISGNYSGICTIYTQTPHNLTVGSTVILGCGWGSWPSTLPTPPQTGSVMCGQWTVSNVLSATGFQFIMPTFVGTTTSGPGIIRRGPVIIGYKSSVIAQPAGLTVWEQGIAASGVSMQVLEGCCAPMPAEINASSLLSASGILLQRPIFAPSDLVVDFTQPDLAEILELLLAVSPGGVIAGLNAYFFNLTWDYSAPTPLTSFTPPQLVNIIIDGNTQQVQWAVAQGQPTGYRISIVDPVTGITYNKFTVDNPNNPEGLTQFKLNPLDFASTRNIVITPFNGLGDGDTYILTNVSDFNITGSQSPGSYSIGCMYNGVIPLNTILVRVPYDIPVQYAANWAPSTAYVETPFTASASLVIQQILQSGPASGAMNIGEVIFPPGSNTGDYLQLGSSVIDFNAGDVIRVIAASVDGVGGNLGMVISGIKN